MDPKSRMWGCKWKKATNRQQQHIQHQHWARTNTGMHMSISRSSTPTAQHCSWATTSPWEPAAGTVMPLSCWHWCAQTQLKALGPNYLIKQLGQSTCNPSRANYCHQEGQTEPMQVTGEKVCLSFLQKRASCVQTSEKLVWIGPDFLICRE